VRKINTFLNDHVAIIAKTLGALGFLGLLLIRFNFPKVGQLCKVITLNNFLTPIGKELFDIYSSFDYLTSLFFIMLIAAGMRYQKSSGEETSLIKFCFSIIGIKNIIFVPIIIFNYFYFSHRATISDTISESPSLIFFAMSAVWCFVLSYIGIYIAKHLSKKDKIEFQTVTGSSGKEYKEWNVVSKGQRFGHYFFDLLFMTMVIWQVIEFTYYHLLSDQYYTSWIGMPSFIRSLAIFLALITYYLIFEGIFRTTPAKFLYKNTVVDSERFNPPKFGTIMIRTLCRRIPFEPFSFFGDKGWHDSLSRTEVVPIKNASIKTYKNGKWLWLIILAYIFSFIIPTLTEYYSDYRKASFMNEAIEKEQTVKIKTLGEGDVIFFKPKSNGYRTHVVVVIDNINLDQITGQQYLVKNIYDIDRKNFIRNGITDNWEKQGLISLSKSEIIKSFQSSYFERTPVKVGTYLCQLQAIEDMDFPLFICDHNGYRMENNRFVSGEGTITFDLYPVTIQKIDVLEGSVEWELTTPPFSPTFNHTRSSGSFKIKFENRGLFKKSLSRMTVETKGKTLNYMIYQYEEDIEIILEQP